MTITRPTLTDNDTLTAAQFNALAVQAVAIEGREVTPAKLFEVAENKLVGRTTGAGDAEQITCTPAGRALLDDADAAAQRATLNLGNIATQNKDSIEITGGKVTAGFFRSVPDAIVYAASVALDFADTQKTVQTIVLTGALTLTTTNLANGTAKVLRLINSSGMVAALILPAGWKPLDVAKPTAIETGKTGMLTLLAFGTADTDVLVRWSVEP